ncbi:acetyl-CoA carboxylase biotin carboxyl carrier protein [Phenylobacterium sp.]|uniref:acetyl-CoA carboxylase biotin carboxyl carrier protein n=1 Tax=Phenylobacterium sp. TaxID=1871053 RepID=UPI002730AA9E|nr:acetyl-CoA carboxylase biotin carboxyl carrier protein [Phenylobacterium sp.]MDP1873932.1 acetyl-CoA carboxylase biotin carboxyl carrier protein [Phenylobacterium sp.]
MASSPKASADPLDARLVRTLADILTETGLSEIEVERDGLKVRVARQISVTATVAAPAAPAMAAAAAEAPVAPAAPVRAAGDAVNSPMVGTVYMQAQPGSPSFIKVGDAVQAGQTLMIIEAMKTMNPIPAPRAGKVVEILVSDAQPVEFGEPLVIIE